jgi:signal transduction histidine kinase
VSPPPWLTDTIARRFILTEILLVGVTVAMAILLEWGGGFWANEPLERSPLLRDMIITARLMDAVPAPLRPSLASAAAASGSTHAYWFGANSPVAPFLEAQENGDEPAAQQIGAALQHKAVVLRVSSSRALPSGFPPDPGGLYGWLLAVRLQDGSWTAFTAPVRMWGAPTGARLLMWISFLTLSIALITAFAARQFAQPIERLAAAVREFGLNPQSSPLAESGPRELRQVVRTFNEMQSQIQRFLAHRTLMLAAISHDLRTPITRLRLRADLIEEEETQRKFIADLDDMEAMIDSTLSFARDDAQTEEGERIDLAVLLETLCDDASDAGHTARYAGPEHLTLLCRPIALQRALTNLIDNAVKYGGEAEVSLAEADAQVEIAVADQGPGIPLEEQEKVFAPFYRLERSRNRATGGSGLGLAVARSIIRAHGGDITLANRPDGGLVARVGLPV